MTAESSGPEHRRLARELGVFGATVLGLGSIIGTGVFVSLGIAAGVAGSGVLIAVVFAAALATCNGLSSAALARSHPVSGGTYEYGYRYLTPTLGFTAGWAFLVAKGMSAATAALGYAAYTLGALGRDPIEGRVLVAIGAVLGITLLVLGGLRRSNLLNLVIVSVSVAALLAFIVAAAPAAMRNGRANLATIDIGFAELGHATALMFVAYTGYGRVATLGEEVRDPGRTIRRAVLASLAISLALYFAVGLCAIAAVGASTFSAVTRETAAPLEVMVRALRLSSVSKLVAIGAIFAMLGVLLNLVLGLSRVLLAMGRRRDLPTILARVDDSGQSPTVAVLVTGLAVALLVAIGDIRLTWGFSAFSVLVYYAITNWAALELPRGEPGYQRAVAWIGLASCLLLAFTVDWQIWLVGLALLAAGHLLRLFYIAFRPA